MSTRRPYPTWVALAIGLVATVVLAALVAVSARPTRIGAAATEVEALREARYPLVRREAYASEARYRTQQAESIVQVLAQRQWPADSLLMLGDSAVPAWQRQFVTTQMRRSWAALAPRRDGIRVVVAFVPFSSRAVALRASPWSALQSTAVFLPDLLDGRTCLVLKPWESTRVPSASQLAALEAQWLDESAELPPIARGPESSTIRTISLPARRATLGACGWLAAYGPPGRGVRAWLDSTAWRAAAYARFVDTPRARAPWRIEYAPPGSPLAMLELLTSGYSADVLPAQSCARGAREACTSYLAGADGLGGERGESVVERGVLMRSFEQRAGAGAVEALDPRPRFLDDLRRELGTERFAAFWKSDADFPAAFAAATGSSLDAWTSRWMAASIRGSDWVTGPSVRLRWIAVWVPLILLLLWATARRVSRQQVGRSA